MLMGTADGQFTATACKRFLYVQFPITCNNYRSKLLRPRHRALFRASPEKGEEKEEREEERRIASPEKFTFLARRVRPSHVLVSRASRESAPNKSSRLSGKYIRCTQRTHRGPRCPGGTGPGQSRAGKSSVEFITSGLCSLFFFFFFFYFLCSAVFSPLVSSGLLHGLQVFVSGGSEESL